MKSRSIQVERVPGVDVKVKILFTKVYSQQCVYLDMYYMPQQGRVCRYVPEG